MVARRGGAPAGRRTSLPSGVLTPLALLAAVACTACAPDPARERPAADLSVTVTASPGRVFVGHGPGQIEASATNQAMCLVPGADVDFESSDPSVARVDARSGEVVGVAPGRVTVTARLGESADSVEIEVVDPYGAPTGALAVTTTPEGRLRLHASLLPAAPGTLPPGGEPVAGRVVMTLDDVVVLEGLDDNSPGRESVERTFDDWDALGAALGVDASPGTVHAVGIRIEGRSPTGNVAFSSDITVPPRGEPVRWIRTGPSTDPAAGSRP